MEENILKFFNKINMIISAIITGMTSVFGIQWILFACYLVLNIIDFVTGCIKARINKTESSAIGLKGIIKKVCYWFLILVAFIISYVISNIGNLLDMNLNYIVLFGWFTLACLTINEVRSILENLVEIGIHVPEFLVKGLKIFSQSLNSNTEKTVDETSNKEE